MNVLPFIRVSRRNNEAAAEAFMREQHEHELAHPRWDPQEQSDGGRYDAEAEGLSQSLADMDDVLAALDTEEEVRAAVERLINAGEGRMFPDQEEYIVDGAVTRWKLSRDTALATLYNIAPPDAAKLMVAAAVKRWMDGVPLTAREQRIVDVVCDTNYATQIGRLCLPYS